MSPKLNRLVGFILIGIGGFLTSSFIIGELIRDKSYSVGNWTGNTEESNLIIIMGIIISCIWYVPFFVIGVYFIKKSKAAVL